MASRHSTMAHLVLLLLSYTAIQVSCLNIDRGASLGQRSLSTPFAFAHLLERADEEEAACGSCAPPAVVGGSSIAVRSLQQWEQRDHNYTGGILSRRMDLPKDDSEAARNTFVSEETLEADQIVWKSDEGHDLNTALFRSFPKTGEFSLATSHLCGCSSLWLISRKGVYASHWWESISFAPAKLWKLTPDETDEEIFQRTVTDHIRNGHVSPKGNTMHEKLVADRIEDPFIKAYLVHPSEPCSKKRTEQYRENWDRIIATVKDIIPTLQDDDRWQEITYKRLKAGSRLLDKTSRGRILFKFDAHHGSRRGPAKAALWVESGGDFHKDEWR